MKNNKALGQHWLKDRAILETIATLAAGRSEVIVPETVVEIGPGLGHLTSALFRHFSRVVAVELDGRLAAQLPQSFPGKNLTVVHADILKLDFASLDLPKEYVIAGNIPYYITAPIIQKCLKLPQKPQRIVLLVQKEVAARLIAERGRQSVLALSAQLFATVTAGPVVPRTFFTPPPKVDSQVVILTPHATPLADESVLKLIKIGFSAPRKKVLSNLAHGLDVDKSRLSALFDALRFSPNARPADLTLADWLKLEKKLLKP